MMAELVWKAGTRRRVTRLIAGAALLAPTAGWVGVPTAFAAPLLQAQFAKGTCVALRGTPHLWFAGERSELHWGGDTRALAGKDINWDSRTEVSFEQLKALPIGDPWLSAGLLKDGEPIYLVKWEASQERPTLLQIQSIADLEVFGINGRNYSQFVLDRPEWERRYGMSAAGLARGQLAPAAALVVDNCDDPSRGVLPTWRTARSQGGYEGGEYVLRELTPNSGPYVPVTGVVANAALAVDARIAGDATGKLIVLGGRENDTGARQYMLLVDPGAGDFVLVRTDGDQFKTLVELTTSSVIRRGGERNRLELSCSGSTIAVRINGTPVVSVQDSTYREGRMWIGVGSYKEGATAEARFDNLLVTPQ
jgi:hypothetical protein